MCENFDVELDGLIHDVMADIVFSEHVCSCGGNLCKEWHGSVVASVCEDCGFVAEEIDVDFGVDEASIYY